MSLPVVFRPEAEQDLSEAKNWYAQRAEGLGEEFLGEVSRSVERLAERPEMYSVAWEDVRSCLLHRFPYLIYYRIVEGRVEVLAVLHGSRDPGSSRARIGP